MAVDLFKEQPRLGEQFNIMGPWFETQCQEKTVTLNEVFAQGIERMTKLQEESFASAQHTATIVQRLEELTTSILAMDTPIVDMQECNLEASTPSEEPTHQVKKEMVFDDDYCLNGLNN